MSYGKQLKQKLIELNISQQELSNQTGISKSSISQYVGNYNEPSDLNKVKIQEVVGEFTQEVPTEYTKNIPAEVASKVLGVSPQFIRIGLQQGIFEFGYAVKMSSQYRYHISPNKFREYVGEELFKLMLEKY